MTAPSALPILLVEDNRDDAALALHALEAAGHRPSVHLVRDGTAALAYLFGDDSEARREALRVVLLDIKLPLIGGIEVLRRIKGDTRARSIPVVMFTSSAEARDLEVCYRLGANSYVVKPVDFTAFSETLSLTVRYWLEVNVPEREPSGAR